MMKIFSQWLDAYILNTEQSISSALINMTQTKTNTGQIDMEKIGQIKSERKICKVKKREK